MLDLFSNENVVIIIVLHRVQTELPGILKFIEVIFRTLFHILENHFLSTCTRVQVIPQPFKILFHY